MTLAASAAAKRILALTLKICETMAATIRGPDACHARA
jgi:hypothetical protein